MTQEELDALMAGGLDEDVALEEEILEEEVQKDDEKSKIDESSYRADADSSWPPPPPTDEHKVVDQLDNVTRDSEEKATEIFDKLEEISGFSGDIEDVTNELRDTLVRNIELFENLSQKFPNIESFQSMLEENQKALTISTEITEKSQGASDEIMMIMDIMQYQDIHRQKIERVINVMRALSKYMNSLFDSDVEDKNRAPTAVHIDGDTADTVDEDEIEALLESFGKK